MTQNSMGASAHIQPVIRCGGFGRLSLAVAQIRLSHKVVKFDKRLKPFLIDPLAIDSFGGDNYYVVKPVIFAGDKHRFIGSAQMRKASIELGIALLKPTVKYYLQLFSHRLPP
jgi:hypothetical protein